MAQAQTKGDKHILVMNDEELQAVRNGVILNTKISANTESGGINLGAIKASIEVLDAVNPILEAAPISQVKKAKA